MLEIDCHSLEIRDRATGKQHSRARGIERPGARLADAPTRSGDECDFASEVHHDRRSVAERVRICVPSAPLLLALRTAHILSYHGLHSQRWESWDSSLRPTQGPKKEARAMSGERFDEERFEQLQGKVMADVGGAIGLLMAHIGDQTGVYQALEEVGPCSHETLADARPMWTHGTCESGFPPTRLPVT